MDLRAFSDSINTTKKNLIRESDSRKAAEKMYPKFPIARGLSYSADALELVNELNIRGTIHHNISNIMHYEFLLYVLDKKKRYASWKKPEKIELLENIMVLFQCNHDRAVEIEGLLDEATKLEVIKATDQGGRSK